jgi:XTP/dITP diphosphohydrolase
VDGLKARSATLASRNEHKARELERLLPGWTIALLETDEFPPEEGSTYYENARAKALFGPADAWTLGEDSGLEVEALGGRPGIRSARYGAEGAEANEKLLNELQGIDDRAARYVCKLVLIAPSGRELRGTGVLEGRIAEEPAGREGFGYDPVFVPEGEDRTVAQLGNDWKLLNSHRGRAARALLGEAGGLLGG